MSTVLRIKLAFEVKTEGVYVLQFNYNPSAKEIDVLQQHFNNIYRDTKARFIIIGANMELLSPTKLTECPDLVEEIGKIIESKLDALNEVKTVQ